MPAPQPTTRRGVLALMTCAPLVLSACRIDPPPTPAESDAPAPPDPDDDQLGEVVDAVHASADRVGATSGAGPALAAACSGFALLHAAHLAVLDPTGTDPDTTRTPSGTAVVPFTSVRELVRHERALQATLATAAQGVASGSLARALSSASAALAMQLATLAPNPGAAR